ncbi:MAG: hypothetical protein O7C62_08765, partial [Rickettsia endosymbiont of Ixodes persulcatus]|nr:hypothetical protein [Rickettsia endosymbiont of Ixodes persulcatus]
MMGAATSYLAVNRGRDPYIWFAIGVLCGILGLIAVVLLPPVKTEEELEAERKDQIIVGEREKQLEVQEKLENAPDLMPQSVEAKDWFCIDKSGVQQGPLSFYSLNQLWEGREINLQ